MEYLNPMYTEEGTAIKVDGGAFIPVNEANSDYQEIMRQVNEEGLVIAPYVAPA